MASIEEKMDVDENKDIEQDDEEEEKPQDILLAADLSSKYTLYNKSTTINNKHE